MAGWFGWIAVALGVLALTPIGFITFMPGGLWILAASIMLALRARGATARPTEDGAPPAAVSPAT